MNAETANVEFGTNDLTALVDVDYYVNMPELLARHPASYLLYTMQPSQAAKSTGEYKYTFNRNREIEYTVSGGAEYRHKLWDWGGDSLYTSTWCCFCIPVNYTGYAVERRRVDDDHQIVLLTPYKRFMFLSALIAHRTISGRKLGRIDPTDGSFARIMVNGSTGMTMSTARLGGYLCATVPVAVDDAIVQAAETSKEFTRSMAVSKMAADTNGPALSEGSEVYVAYIKEKQRKLNTIETKHHRISLVDGVRPYQYVLRWGDYEPALPSMESFMNPFIDAAFVAERSRNNDERTVQTRVKTPDDKGKSKLKSFHIQVMEEFTDLLAATVGKLHPVEYEEVYAKQNRPTQRSILERSENETDDGRATAMQKAEAYRTANDPRNITIVNGPSKREHSKWMYALYEAMAKVEWYAFGKKPAELAQQVTEICLGAEWWFETDLSRQDMNIGEYARMLEVMLMTKLFDKKYWEELLKAMRSQTFLTVVTKFGVKYNSKLGRASGSAETAVFNTILTAFIFFLAFRMTRNRYTGEFFIAAESWAKLGLYGGDDGGTADVDPKNAEKAARIMGQKLTSSRIMRGELGVKFLARCYGPDVWYGDTNSCCDIRRQLSKFHTCVRLNNLTAAQKLCEKSFAFSLSDLRTPILGPFIKKVLEISRFGKEDFENVHKIWNAQYDVEEVQYPNFEAPWMTDIVERDIPDFKWDTYNRWLSESDTLFSLMSVPRLTDEVKVEMKPGLVVVEGECYSKENPPPPKVDTKRKKMHRPRTRNAYRNGQPNRRPATN